MADPIERQAEIDALEAQERQRATQKRRYTFGNNEFSLEAAYHDCKLVFDGITDDDSFQEADTGLILYFANEIIYALHEALEGKDTNVPTNDCISRQAAIDTITEYGSGNSIYMSVGELKRRIEALPPAQQWILCSERLPEYSGRYLVSVLDGIDRRTTVAPYHPQSRTWSLTGRMAYWKVIAWMPLPEPYKERREE